MVPNDLVWCGAHFVQYDDDLVQCRTDLVGVVHTQHDAVQKSGNVDFWLADSGISWAN